MVPGTALQKYLFLHINRFRKKRQNLFPLPHDINENSAIVGAMWAVIHWAQYFENQLPETARGLVFVLENSCNMTFTYRIDGGTVTPLGDGDRHDPKFDEYERTASFENVISIEDGTATGLEIDHNGCPFSIRVYPSKDFLSIYFTNTPLIVTLSVLSVFFFAILMFFTMIDSWNVGKLCCCKRQCKHTRL